MILLYKKKILKLFFIISLFLYFQVNSLEFIDKSEESNIKYHKLKNGLDVYVIVNKKIPAVFHAIIYKVGGMDDPIGKTGLAHYFEHLMFETSGNFSDIESSMSKIGAQFNAFTTREYTCYYELVLKNDLQLVMEIEADRMENFNITQEKINKEKNIVLEERKMRIDSNPRNLLFEEMDNVFYRNEYGRPVIGLENDIKTYSYEDIKRFYDNYYHPGNSILLIVGDVEFNETIKLVEQKYGKIKSKNIINRNYTTKDLKSKDIDLSITFKSSEIKEPILYFRYPVPLLKTIDEIFTVNLLVEILGIGKSSKLYKNLVLNKNIAVSTFVYYNNPTFSNGYIDIEVIPKNGVSLKEIEIEIDKTISDFIFNGITDEELQSAKYKYKSVQFDKISDLTGIAFFYIPFLALDITCNEIGILNSKINNINLKSINSKIYTIFSSNKLVGYLVPKKKIL